LRDYTSDQEYQNYNPESDVNVEVLKNDVERTGYVFSCHIDQHRQNFDFMGRTLHVPPTASAFSYILS
jgi:hypothetical protein